jgi:DtxR family Mn-dependent transcriptional regulator
VAQGHSTDTYLETIYFLAFPVGEYGPVVKDSPALAARVADMLGVSRASAGEMLKRLEADGLIERGERKEVILTEAGRVASERVIRRHRLIERFLTDFLGYTAGEAHEQADELADTFSDDMIERMTERLGNPDRCPHGWPVDPAVEQAENRELSSLADLEPGTLATIVRLAEHDGPLLHWFYDEGLVPGTEVEVRTTQPEAGQVVVRIAGADRAIGERAAAGLFVRRAA